MDAWKVRNIFEHDQSREYVENEKHKLSLKFEEKERTK